MVDVLTKIGKPGLTLPSWELNTIVRDPPRSYYTKYKPKVDDRAIIQSLLEDEAYNRYDEGIAMFPRGQNLMRSVNYSNNAGNGANLTTMQTLSASQPIKAKVIRPPIIPPTAFLPLSRQKRVNFSVQAKPKLPYIDLQDSNRNDFKFQSRAIQSKILTSAQAVATIKNADIERQAVYTKNSVRPHELLLSVATNKNYKIETGDKVILDPNAVRDYVVNIAKTSNPSFIQQQDWSNQNFANYEIREPLRIENLQPNFRIILYDPNTHDEIEVEASTKDKENIAVQSAQNLPIQLVSESGEKIKLSNYKATAVTSNPNSSAGGVANILQIDMMQNLELNRSLPQVSAATNVSSLYKNGAAANDLAQSFSSAARNVAQKRANFGSQMDFGTKIDTKIKTNSAPPSGYLKKKLNLNKDGFSSNFNTFIQ